MKISCKIPALILGALLFCLSGFAQKPERWNSATIYHHIKKLSVLGSALYLGAHPDDENTRLISYLGNERYMNTAYLSLTRGDGGQNLTGTEIAELLGVIRTQELLAARRTDGGTQMFTRANDFGFSKNPDETLRIWNRNEVLSDVVWAIRKWQPDVIINRFDANSAGRTHGHHTASAMLSLEAYEQAANKNAFPEQLQFVEPWQPHRIFFNTSWWFYGSRENFEKADKSNMVSLDAGVYYPILGKSNNEIAAESRSMHKSQGFGSMSERGSQLEYLQLLRGDSPKNNDPFDGINTTWSRVKGGAPTGDALKRLEADFRLENPAASVPALMQAYAMMGGLPDGYWKRVKMAEIRDVIAACMGLFAEASATVHSATPGEAVSLNLEIINRSDIPCLLDAVRFVPTGQDTTMNVELPNNQKASWMTAVSLPQDMPLTNAYWLNKKWETGMYTVEDQTLRGLPETPRTFKVMFSLRINGQPFMLDKEVVYKYGDNVKGEVYQPFEVTPPVFVSLPETAYLFTNNAPLPVKVVVKSGAPNVRGTLTLCHPEGWRIDPEQQDFSLNLKGEEKAITFNLYPPDTAALGLISPLAKIGGAAYSKSVTTIGYDHIPTQTILLDAEAKAARIDLKKAGSRVAYIMGAGDKIPESLRQTGYTVDVLDPDGHRDDINVQNLLGYDAVVIGVRAYNTVERLQFDQPKLMEYVKEGGTLIVQYNTNGDLVLPMEEMAPYKLHLSRDRVTVEDAEVRFLAPDHELLNYPNKITEKDFEGWMQERGLYFADEWGDEFTPVLSCNDPGEPPCNGGLLVANYGKGHYIYTGYSWFRELPAGVPGAFRIFANMISIGKKDKP
ncbi:MAG: LmbE family protein [Saprospiraceae bacterium]|nr:MAG: LmbE family protein [Saprospiraceae bacterium]